MFSENIKWHLKYRFGTLSKYTIAEFFYFEETQNKFVARKGYSFYLVYIVHIIGYLICSALAAYVWFLLNPNKIPDQVIPERSTYNKYLLSTVCALVIFMICSFIMITNSSEIDNLPEVLATLNQGFTLNEIL